MARAGARVGAAAGALLLTLASAQFLVALDTSVMNASIATVAADVGTVSAARSPKSLASPSPAWTSSTPGSTRSPPLDTFIVSYGTRYTGDEHPEGVWSHLKRSLGNLAVATVDQLVAIVRNRLKRSSTDPTYSPASWPRPA